jgi:hypothetical protein
MLHREQTVTRYKRVGTAEQQITETKIAWILSTPGQQAVAENRAELETAAAVQSFIAAASLTGLVHERTTISINTRNTIQGKPRATLAISLRKRTAKPPGTQVNPGNVRQVSSAGLILALGSGTAQRRVEFSMPYAPDDYFSGPSGGPYTLVRGDHATKATNFGRVQNRLFLGNRSGMNLQLAPERLPEAPFAPMYVQANGLTAQYRANGNQWAGDSNGLVCSTDALFWAAVGGTGTFWFPVAPGVTSLPATPPAVDGQLNPAIAILPYNETVEVSAVVRTALRVQRFSYSLQPHTTDIGRVVIRTKVKAARVNLVFMPAPPAITLSAPTPQIGQAVEVVQSYIFLLHMTPNVPSISTT